MNDNFKNSSSWYLLLQFCIFFVFSIIALPLRIVLGAYDQAKETVLDVMFIARDYYACLSKNI